MNESILTFLSVNRIAVLSVMLDDGSIHSSTVHFSEQKEPLKFYFQTSNETLKAQPFVTPKTVKGALVVGFSEQDWVTFQAHGNVRQITDEAEIKLVSERHYLKMPDAEKRRGPKTVFLEFAPTWWRYTDFKTKPITIYSS